MTKLMKLADKFRAEEDGAAMVEYAVLIGLITLVLVVTIGALGTTINGMFGNVNNAIGG